ncbi:MAG: hypothetical protein JST23_03125 [Bacteroidetes bacterium]|nr:hypothetical protein [Bacteroidota bacterium]
MDLSELNREKSVNIKRHPWEITRARIVYSFLKKEKNIFDHILDIGSGDVFILNNLQKQNLAIKYTAVDTEYTNDIINILKSNNNSAPINFLKSTEEITKGVNDFDGLLLLDVLEHCKDDHSVLTNSISKIQNEKNAAILITVPAFQSLFSEHDKILNHYRRYGRKQLISLCIANNLVVKKSGYFFFSLVFLRAISKFLEKIGLKKTKKTIDNWKGEAFSTRLLTSMLWLDFKLCNFLSNLGIHLPGLSCYCICQKLPS